MHCANCGTKNEEGAKFCAQCGRLVTKTEETSVSVDRWWNRLAKVIYIALHLPLLLVVPIVWSENAPYYSSYYKEWSGSYGEAFWYSLLTFVFYLAVLRLIKLAVLYVTAGCKPEWKKEFKKFY